MILITDMSDVSLIKYSDFKSSLEDSKIAYYENGELDFNENIGLIENIEDLKTDLDDHFDALEKYSIRLHRVVESEDWATLPEDVRELIDGLIDTCETAEALYY